MDIFLEIFSWLWDKIVQFANSLLSLLPQSPFTKYLTEFSNLPYLGWLNWFLPIKDFVAIGLGWCAIIGLYYGYQIILRWIKAID